MMGEKIAAITVSTELGMILDHYSNNLAAEIQKIWEVVADTIYRSTMTRLSKALPWLNTTIIEQPVPFYGLPAIYRRIWFINPMQDKVFFLSQFDPPIQTYSRTAQQYLDLLTQYANQDVALLICYIEEE